MGRLCSARYEREARQHGWRRIAGLDEAGRGSLFGPVVAAVVILNPRRRIVGLDDSKKLAPEARDEFATLLRQCAMIGLGAASVTEIDRINILQASFLAMRRALAALPVAPMAALVDGNCDPRLPCPAHTVVGGDGLSLSIAAASVVAKVARDRLMQRLATRYDGYGWTTNVGYGTPEHRAAIVRLGLTPHHRLSFQPSRDLFEFAASEVI